MMRYLALFLTLLLLSSPVHAVPRVIQHQGRVLVSGVNFTGTAGFKFALVSSDGATTFWSNDGTSAAGSEPTGAVPLTVTNGSYTVGLGDTTLANMQVVPPSVFIANNDVRLRVWFNDGSHGWQLLTPDQRLAAVAWALSAREAETVADGSVTSAKIANGAVTTSALASGAVTSAKIANGGVSSTALASGAAAANLGASGYSAVGTGGIVFGHSSAEAGLIDNGFMMQSAISVGETWMAMTDTGAPTVRTGASSVWTGTEWIIWGGIAGEAVTVRTNTGARYNPKTDTWTPMSTTNAPTARNNHSAVWTGTEMWVFGGRTGTLAGTLTNTGGVYNPATNTWTALPTTGAPSAREFHTASWFGTGMLICAGTDASGVVGTTGRLNQGATAWLTPASITARKRHSASVTGNYVFLWGGEDGSGSKLNSGSRYDAASDTWLTTNTTNAASARCDHAAVVAGDAAYIWGGLDATDAPVSTGAIYNIPANTWTVWDTSSAPTARSSCSACFTGSKVLIWGGVGSAGNARKDGASFTLGTGTWLPMVEQLGPTTRYASLSAWTGTHFLIWGGTNGTNLRADGYLFNPNTTLWMYVRQ